MFNKKNKKCLSIDFGKKTINFAVGSYNNFELVIDKLFVAILDEEIYDNGYILDKDAMIDIMKEALKENKVKVKDTICIVESSEIIRRELTIPQVDDDDIDDIVSTEIGHALSIDLEKFTIKSKIIETFKENSGEKIRLSVAILSNDIIEAHRDIIKSLKLTPSILDLGSSSMENLMRYIVEKNLGNSEYRRNEIIENCIAMVEIGYSSANINIFKNGKLKFNRFIKIKDKSHDGRFLNLTRYKSIDEVNDMEIFNEINNIITEIDMVFKYYTNINPNNKIGEIFIFGGLGNTEGLDKYMEDIINITTNRIDSINTVIDADEFDVDISLYLNAISGIIRW